MLVLLLCFTPLIIQKVTFDLHFLCHPPSACKRTWPHKHSSQEQRRLALSDSIGFQSVSDRGHKKGVTVSEGTKILYLALWPGLTHFSKFPRNPGLSVCSSQLWQSPQHASLPINSECIVKPFMTVMKIFWLFYSTTLVRHLLLVEGGKKIPFEQAIEDWGNIEEKVSWLSINVPWAANKINWVLTVFILVAII